MEAQNPSEKCKRKSYFEKSFMWKYLGVIVDGKLSCKGHCKLLCCIIFKNVGAMYKVKCYVNDHTLRMLYHSLRFFNVFRCCHACLILLRCEWE